MVALFFAREKRPARSCSEPKDGTLISFPELLLAEDFLHVADFFLNLPAYFVGSAAIFHFTIAGGLACLLLYGALRLINVSFDFVLSA